MSSPPTATAVPRVRVVVLNYEGGDHVLACLDRLAHLEWPAEALEIVVVDNASTDGSDREIARRFPDVDLRPTGTNLGFPANNLALGDLDGIDHVLLVNNDAFVTPGLLPPLVAALESDPGLGAACPRILFAPGFVEVTVTAPVSRVAGDPRPLGVRVSGVRVDGVDRTADAQLAAGHHGPERGPEGSFRWTGGEAVVRVPVSGAPTRAELRLAADRPKTVVVASGGERCPVEVGVEATWHAVPLAGARVDVVNNVGTEILVDGSAADRGFLEVDRGQYDVGSEVFAWCGAAVLLRADYLRAVGGFDERFFMYYEDVDLAWRGRWGGWRYRYVPEAVVRHVHAATSVEGSAMFQFHVERNRLLVLAIHAPAPVAAGAVVRHALVTASYARRDVAGPLRRGHRPDTGLVRSRIRALAGFGRLLPHALARRRAVRRGAPAVADPAPWMVRR